MRFARALSAVIAAATLIPCLVHAQATRYPTKPARILVGAPAGGSTDFLARLIASELTSALGQPYVVENRAGASGNIAMEAVAKSEGDGYTLLMGFTSMVINPSLFIKLPFDPLKDFAPITLVGKQTSILVAHPGVPANNIRELIDLAKRKPGSLNIGIGSTGSALHLTGEAFKLNAGVNIVDIPYKGVAPAQVDLLGGQVQLMFTAGAWVMQQIATGSVKALAVAGQSRLSTLPNVPTLVEAGYPNTVSYGWYGLFAPAGTPAAVVQKIHSTLVKPLNSPATRERMAVESIEIANITPQEFSAFLREEVGRWNGIAKAAGIKPE